MLVIASVAGPPKGGSVPSWQYTSRKDSSSCVRIMAWLPADLPAELLLAANNRCTVAPPSGSRCNQPDCYRPVPEWEPIERPGRRTADKLAAGHLPVVR